MLHFHRWAPHARWQNLQVCTRPVSVNGAACGRERVNPDYYYQRMCAYRYGGMMPVLMAERPRVRPAGSTITPPPPRPRS